MESTQNLQNLLQKDSSISIPARKFERVVPRCCGCIAPQADTPELPLKAVGLDFSIEDGKAKTNMCLKYLNEGSSPLEVQFQFPSDPEFALTQIRVKIGDKEIETKIMEKEKAEQKYEDSTASGNTGV